MKNTVTQERIDHLINSADVKVETAFDKCTIVTVRLENGFVLVASSGCVNPDNYDPELGKRICLSQIEERLWELEGYALQKSLHEPDSSASAAGGEDDAYCAGTPWMDFGQAIAAAKKGFRIAREGWNGKKQYVELASGISYRTPEGGIQNADHEAIGNAAFAFCGTSGVQMGWLASQADMLAEDWKIV